MFELNKTSLNKLKIATKGGDLSVEFNKTLRGYDNISLTGSVKMVYSGEIQI
jgi:diaminopimelate epimerase